MACLKVEGNSKNKIAIEVLIICHQPIIIINRPNTNIDNMSYLTYTVKHEYK